jgi:choline dehydrogenase-like flavoprotein
MIDRLNDIHFKLQGESEHSYDAIVIGSGISGGWAAKELCEKGLKTLVLERGRNVVHNKDYPTANLNPWLAHRRICKGESIDNPGCRLCRRYQTLFY